jgi:hypothetical protein
MTRDIAIKCPVCCGSCKSDDGQECKPCGGKGILWGKETDDACMLPAIVTIPYPVPQPAPLPSPLPWWQGPIWYGGSTTVAPLLPGPPIVNC